MAQGELPDTYSHRDLLELGRITYNNIKEDDGGWKTVTSKAASKGAEEKNFLALATEIMKKVKGTTDSKTEKRIDESGKHTFLSWRFENPNGDATKEVRGTIMKWCKNDCHPKPLWCGRKT